ncbi:hypothetical protein GCM10010977_10130 [Citricoccus zhacaiensis]|uniref:Secreted protein n=1 Tax=Citricoccus zhacaiensis TaxID=489142 RepID=A0ABQ2LTF0_9MICC|nr:hypothetical protein [Citricoccus zhacaiensis]GGO42984.1 hypothetical protein GCM10010977_10130 [Citricoccus zhacaiensis]
MKPVVRLAALAAGVAAVLGIRSWRENERGKQVWSSATDSLDSPGSPREHHPDAHN